MSRSVASELRSALNELFAAMSVKELKVESNLCLGISNFVSDFIKVVDEIKTAADIVNKWHISPDIARKMFSTLNEVLNEDGCSDSDGSEASGEDDDFFDEESEDPSTEEDEDTDEDQVQDQDSFDDY